MAVLAVSALTAGACGGGGTPSPFAVDDSDADSATDEGGKSGEELAGEIVKDALDLELGNESGGDSRALDVDVEVVTGFEANALAADGSLVWMADTDNNVIRSFDTATGDVGDDIEVGRDPAGIAVDGDEVWVANSHPSDHTVMRVSASTGEIEVTVETKPGTSPTGLALTGEHVWVGIGSRGAVAQIDRDTGELLGVVADDPSRVSGGGQKIDVIATDTSVWSIDRFCGRVIRIDPARAEIAAIYDDLGYVAENEDSCTGSIQATGPARLAAFEGGVFVLASVLDDSGGPAGRIYRIDEATNQVTTVVDLLFTPPAGNRHGLPGLVVEAGGIWLSGGEVSVRVDRRTGRVDGAFAAETSVALVEADGVIWHAVIDPFFSGASSGLYGVDTAAATAAAS